MPIVIKKKVALDFLGADYENAYLVFQSIPLKDFDKLSQDIEEAQKDKRAAMFILDALKNYFVEGEFPGIDKLTKDDLDGLDQESVIKCFSIFTGQDIGGQPDSLKAGSTSLSSTEAPGPEN